MNLEQQTFAEERLVFYFSKIRPAKNARRAIFWILFWTKLDLSPHLNRIVHARFRFGDSFLTGKRATRDKSGVKGALKIGTIGKIEFKVEEQHAIDFAEGEMPAILSTPWLIWFMEHSAREAVLPVLEPGESTVGVQIDIQHLAATPVGDDVVCKARIIYTDGTLVSFQLEAHDSQEILAKGSHKLRVIKVDRFAKRVQKKSGMI